MQKPRVSVIMPVYNCASYIGDAIASILSQTLADFELIVVDNGSTDGSKEYAESIADPRVRVISEQKRGAGNATNAGYLASCADLVATMDSDDIAHPERLRLQVEFFDAHPDAVLVGTRFAFLVGKKPVSTPSQPRDHDEIWRALMDGRPVICNPSTMARKREALAVGGHRFPGPGADFDYFLRMGEVGSLHNMPAILHYYRMHDGMTSIVKLAEVNKVHGHARACVVARATRKAEPSREEFEKIWEDRSPYLRLRERGDCMALMLYRRAIVMRSEGRMIRAIAISIIASMMSPTRTLWHLKRRLGLC